MTTERTMMIQQPEIQKTDCLNNPSYHVHAGEIKNFVSGEAYECRMKLVPEDEGGFSAFAVRLPGIVGQGETREEAISDIAEAFAAAVSVYRELNTDIPWAEIGAGCSSPAGSVDLWVVVNV